MILQILCKPSYHSELDITILDVFVEASKFQWRI